MSHSCEFFETEIIGNNLKKKKKNPFISKCAFSPLIMKKEEEDAIFDIRIRWHLLPPLYCLTNPTQYSTIGSFIRRAYHFKLADIEKKEEEDAIFD
jgi:hypothetical protein